MAEPSSGTADCIVDFASVTLPKETNAPPAAVTFKKSRRVIMVFYFYTGLYGSHKDKNFIFRN